MSNNPDSASTSVTDGIDMSWEAIWQRLRRVDELNELCRYLGEYQPVAASDGADSESQNDAGQA